MFVNAPKRCWQAAAAARAHDAVAYAAAPAATHGTSKRPARRLTSTTT